MPPTNALDKAREKFRAKMEKRYGPGAVHSMEDMPDYQVISTGSLTLDFATGVGGLIRGRISEYWGNDGLGKSSLAWLAAREALIRYPDRAVAWIDVEHAADGHWVSSLGLDRRQVELMSPGNAEESSDMLRDALDDAIYSLVVLDSIGAMIPKVAMEKDADESAMGRAAQTITRMSQLAAQKAREANSAVLFINQVRADFGNPKGGLQTAGGWNLRHMSTMKMRFKRTATPQLTRARNGVNEPIGQEIAVLVERNRVAPRGRVGTFMFFLEETEYGPVGVDRADEAVTLGTRLGVVKQDGSWYYAPDGTKMQGKKKLVDYLRSFPDLIEQIRQQAIAARADEVLPDEYAAAQFAGEEVEPE